MNFHPLRIPLVICLVLCGIRVKPKAFHSHDLNIVKGQILLKIVSVMSFIDAKFRLLLALVIS